MTDCWNEDHFQVNDAGELTPQPWMQWRHVATTSALSKAGSYPVTLSSGDLDIFGNLTSLFGSLFQGVLDVFGGVSGALSGLGLDTSAIGNKNDLLHDLRVSWTNDSPLDQWVYGKITRGGARVSLQARSRGGLLLSSGYKSGSSVPDADLASASMFGCGGDMGNAGTLAVGTQFCVLEQRMNSTTIPLAPEKLGWYKLAPAATLTARATLRFISELWETTAIADGDWGSESSYETGDTRLDLFAVPVL